jgi:hypothetical protein
MLLVRRRAEVNRDAGGYDHRRVVDKIQIARNAVNHWNRKQ